MSFAGGIAAPSCLTGSFPMFPRAPGFRNFGGTHVFDS
jgi:hypothetical protein